MKIADANLIKIFNHTKKRPIFSPEILDYAANIAAHLSCGRMAAALFHLIVLLVKVVLIGHEAGACVAAGTHEVGQIVFGIGRTTHGFPMHLTIVPEPVEEVAAQGGILVHGKVSHVFEAGHVVLVVIE